jgi:hypothetical protein
VRVVMTLLVRDEADVVEANIVHHLAAGVDAIVATDNGSVDGTREILARYADEGRLRLIDEPAHDYRQYAWVTRMARVAATELGADWVLHNDADQFWWPEAAPLRDVLASVPPEYGILSAPKLDFLPPSEEPGDEGDWSFADRLTVRRAVDLRPGRRRPAGTSISIAHRAEPDVTVGQGNHSLLHTRLAYTPPWWPIVILHFPYRSYARFERKIRNGGAAYQAEGTGVPSRSGKHWRRLYEVWQAGGLEAEYAAMVPTPEQLRDGLARGELVEDRRLQRRLAEVRGRPLPGEHPDPAPRMDLVRAADAAAAAAREHALERELGTVRKELARREKELARLRHEIEEAPALRRIGRRLARVVRAADAR